MANPTPRPWAVILCKFSDRTQEPMPRTQVVDLFTDAGIGKGGMVDYWRDVSEDFITVKGSQVFGWFTLSHTESQDKLLKSDERFQRAIQLATDNGVDLKPYYGIIVIRNAEIEASGMGPGALSVINKSTNQVINLGSLAQVTLDDVGCTVAAHEIGHGFNLPHSFDFRGPTYIEYGDPWDIMSAQTVFLLNDPNFKTKGPVLNGPYRYSLGWMRPSSVHAVAVSGGKVVESSVDLAPLNAAVSSNPRLIRIDLPWGPLGAKTVFVEYRTKGGWDGAIPKDVVLVHDFMNQVSYLRAVLDPPSRRLEVFGLHVIREDVYVDQAYDLRIAVRGLNAATGTITIEISTIPFVQLVGKITTESRSTVSTGVYHFPSGGPTGEMICGQAEFAYSRVLQEQKATYQVQATGFKDGPELEWSINTAELVGLQGQVSARVSRTAPMPPPGGITTNNYSALIDYQITGNTITLKNKPSDGMYTILLGVKATDSSGREASWHLPLTFLGDVLSFGPEYNKHMALCLAKTKARTAELVDIPRRLVKEWNPSPISQKVRAQVDRIFALAAAAEKSEPELASALLTAASQVYKVSFRTAGLPELKIRNKRERKRR